MKKMELPPRMAAAEMDWNNGVTRLSTPNGKPFIAAGPLKRLLVVAKARGLAQKLSAETVAALEDQMRKDGCSSAAIGLVKTRLRTYARYSGEGIDWADASGNTRCTVAEGELPSGMRRYLKTCRAQEVAGISSALRLLVETARERGIKPELSLVSGNALTARVRARGWSQKSIISLHAKLRKYAYETGEGMCWATDSAETDRRNITQVLSGPLWDGYRDTALALLDDGHPERAVRIVDRWLGYRRAFAEVSEAEVLRFSDKVHTIQNLTLTMSLIDPGHPDNRVLEQARTMLRRRSQRRAKHEHRFANLPDQFVEALERIQRMPKAKRPADSILGAMASALRRLVKSAESRNLPPVIDSRTAAAFAQDIYDDATVTNRSGQAYCDFMRRFVTLSGIGAELAEDFRITRNEFSELGRHDLRRKVKALAAQPLELAEVARSASDLLNRAPEVPDLRSRRTGFTLAAAAALLCKLPLRQLDLRGACVGREFARDSEGWQVDITTSKTGTVIAGRLADCLTPYLDALILMDVDAEHFWSIHEKRLGQPLLLNLATGKAYSENWLWSNFRKLTNHGTHVMRTLMYDECVLGDDLDELVAAALCGHASTTSRKFYEVNGDRYRRQEGARQLAALNAQLEDTRKGDDRTSP